MALHPTGHVAAAQLEPMIRMLILVHAFALACVPVLFLGSWGLSRRFVSPSRVGTIGLVLYTFALLAVANAAIADGLVQPGVFRQTVASAGSPTAIDSWRMLSRYTFYWNQAYAQVFVAASSAAILAWSIGILRSGILARGLGIYGCIVGPLTVLALFSGHLPLDAHGFGIVMLGQSAWFAIAGILLWNAEGPASVASA
jgi:hypothetical protein